MKILTPNDKFIITFTATDGETDLHIRAKVFDKELNDTTPTSYYELSHVYGGLYAYKHTSGFANGKYIALFEVYEDSGFVHESKKYGTVEEDIYVSDFLDQILTEIPDNILLDDDSRLNNLNTIPSLSKEITLTNGLTNVINSLEDVIDDSDGGAV